MQKIRVIKADITILDVDAIVNAANKTLLGGGGVDGAIHKAAGKELLEECKTLDGCETGEAKITKGYNLKAKYVIHTVGPVYSGKESDAVKLASCYKNSMDILRGYGLHSIAFPSISTGVYRYPIREAAAIAVDTVKKWLVANKDYNVEVVFCTYGQEAYDVYEELLS